MNGPRIVLVARRFWPLADDEAVLATQLACALADRGWPTTVLTCRWLSHWPATFDFNGVQVARVSRPPSGWLAALGYRRGLTRWLEKHHAEFDVAMVFGLEDDAATVIAQAEPWGLPVVLRVLQTGPGGECHRQMHAPAGARIRRQTARAAAIVAGSTLAERELIAAGYPRDRIRLISSGVSLPEPRNAAQQLAARAAVASADANLILPDEAWLALHVTRAGQEEETGWLLRSWRQVMERLPRTWLWLLGEPAPKAAAAKQIADLRLLSGVSVAGSFDDEHEFYLAADTIIETSPQFDPSLALLRGMSAELPPVVAVETGHDSPVVDGRSGRRVTPRHVESLVAALEQLQSRPDWAAELGTAARRFIAERHAVSAELDQYQELFATLLKQV